MQLSTITKNLGEVYLDNSRLHRLTGVLNSAGIGTWSMDTRNNQVIACDLSRQLMGIVPHDGNPLRKALKQLYPTSIRKIYYAFYAAYHHYDPIYLEVKLEQEQVAVDDKWICLTGTFDPCTFYFSGLVYDITERKNFEANTSSLIAKLNHELRGPLTTVKLYTQRSLNMALNDNHEIAPFLKKADQQINRMNDLIDDFLLVSTTDNRRLALKKSFFFIHDLISEVLSVSFSGCYDERIIIRVDKSHKVYADLKKLIQVLNNYISNAIKYSPPDSEIVITCEKLKDELKISVRDVGSGVNPVEKGKIFQKYYRSKSVSGVQGYGIGLFVVREIIEAHHGKFGVISKRGEGATFYFSLPLHAQ